MNYLAEVTRWLTDPQNWAGPAGIGNRLSEHVQISLLSVTLACVVALPAGLAIGHFRRGRFVVVSVANLGRAIPSFAILALALPVTIGLGLGLGFWPTVIALFLLAIPPILTNTYVGIEGVDADTVEAARGMGMSEAEVLFRLELPLAAPLVVAGLRTSVVQVVATATLAALVAWGGLGRFIIDGFAIRDNVQILGGAILVAALAVAAELLFEALERLVTPMTARSKLAAMPGPGAEAAATGRQA